MRRQRQPNAASCLTTSVAMILDMDVEDLHRELGHDGMADIGGEFRGFHPQELIVWGLDRGIWMTLLAPVYAFADGETGVSDLTEALKFPHVILGSTPTGKCHAVACVNGRCFDPANNAICGVDYLTPHLYLVIKSI